MKFNRIPLAATCLALAAVGLWPQRSFAFSAQPVNMADLVRRADQIVTGTVTDVSQGIDEHGIPYTQIQLRVAESIRGGASGTLTFRQLGFQTPQPAADGRKPLNAIAGMPAYAKDDHVMLFLARTSNLGMRSTIGLGQGRFALRGGQFQNGANNAGLFRNVDFSNITLNEKEQFLTTTQVGALQADTFVNLVRRAVNERWWAPVTPPARPSNPARPGARKNVLAGGPGVGR